MKSLQQWYRGINGTFLDRNFYRCVESVFAHLVEVSRGLAVAATSRRKRNIKAEEFLPKTLAWWLAVCGRAGVSDIEEMLWLKFPAVCPYCQRPEHQGKYCKESDPRKAKIVWDDLSRIGTQNRPQKPKSLAEWQQMFNEIYPRSADTNHETNVTRIGEEIGELAEAVRALPVAPQYFISKAPDVFAWLMGFANQFDYDRQEELPNYGTALTDAMRAEYPGYCKLCKWQVCKCAPIPSSTLGRIAHEAPREIAMGRLFSLHDSIELFKRAESVTVGDMAIDVSHSDEINKIFSDTTTILEMVQQQAQWTPALLVEISAALGGLKQVAEQGEVTQAAVNRVLTALELLPSEQRQTVVGFLNNLAASGTFAAILAAAQVIR